MRPPLRTAIQPEGDERGRRFRASYGRPQTSA
jgi:hypothetical protein